MKLRLVKLRKLHCYDNNIIELDVDNFINLGEIFCQDNDIERLELGGCTNLRVLYTSGNPLNYVHTDSESMGAYPVTVSSQTGGHVELQREQVWIQYLPLTAAAYADEGYEFTAGTMRMASSSPRYPPLSWRRAAITSKRVSLH